ncbi:MAG: hypothetical protein IT379_34225 [Deltaproteobacteria bacterium]|nr:hypothetical protein [Deltaproteobacteria bacterium]
MPKRKKPVRDRGTAKPTKSWPAIVLEVLAATRGEDVRLGLLYELVESHPEARKRAATNRNVRAKVRQVLQALRDREVVESVRPGVWRLRVADTGTEPAP